ncbi:MAG: FAD-binding oxidoreductase [Rhodospirillales bacterium]|nr:FAD-binding oxidoreductase [Rhodospirillales bacterium]
MGSSSAVSFARSLWAATAREAPVTAGVLTGERRADVAVLGGGITGCAAALALAEAGASVALLEAQEIGWGGSGRNGGQVIPGLKHDPSELRAMLGEAQGSALADAVGRNADLVFGLIERHGIACDAQRGGWIQAAHALPALARVQQRAREWQALGAPVELLDAATLAARTGAVGYHGGWLDRRAGTVQPLAYARGLARAAQRCGAALFAPTRVTRLLREPDGWRLATPIGSVKAGAVIVGTDGYTDGLVPGLAQTLLTVQSALVATEPLPPPLLGRIMPDGLCASETRRLAFYFRCSPDGRLLFGGRGAVGDGERAAFTAALVSAMHRIFPDTAQVPAAFRWSGQVAMTLDGMPHLHEPAPGLLVGVGYNGRGVAMATLMGQWLAALLHRAERPPLPVTPLAPIPWHALRRPAIALGIGWAWARDRLGLAA